MKARKARQRPDETEVEVPVESAVNWVGPSSNEPSADGLIRVEHEVTRILADSVSFADAGPEILLVLSRYFAAAIGELWVLDDNESALFRLDACVADTLKYGAFNRQGLELRFGRGEGLPGRVWKSRQPIWIGELARDPNFTRAESAARNGLQSGLAFPIMTGEDFCGVMDFFTLHLLKPDPKILNTLAAVGSEIGQFIKRRNAEKVLRESEERHRSVINTLVDGIITINAEGLIESFNPAAERIFGYRASEVLGSSIGILMTESDSSAHAHSVRRYLETGKEPVPRSEREVLGRRKDGSTFPTELAVSEFRHRDAPMFTGVLRDISERKRFERQLQELNGMLEQRIIDRTARLRSLALQLGQTEQRERQRLAQVLHDELQQLLVAANMKSSMLRRLSRNEEAMSLVEQVEDLIRRSIETTRRLALNLSPPVLHRSSFRESLDWLAVQMAVEYDLRVEIIGSEVEPESETIRTLLFQIVRELLFNVFKHSGTRDARVRLGSNDTSFCIEVEDNGQGFDLSTLSDHGHLSSFGLFSIQERLIAVGGTLNLESSPGDGCRAAVVVPRPAGPTAGDAGFSSR